jgi:hypothetical protein
MQDEIQAPDPFVEKWRHGFGFCAFIGFGISLVVHLLTFLGLNISEHVPWIWVLHLGIFVFGVPMVFSSINLEGRKDFWRKYFAPMPHWVRYVVYGFFAYTAINFIIFFALTHEGSPDIRGGKYVLRSDGRPEDQRVIREISKEEYDLRNDRILRGFSGHWMIFYLVPALYFWFPRNDEPRNDDEI